MRTNPAIARRRPWPETADRPRQPAQLVPTPEAHFADHRTIAATAIALRAESAGELLGSGNFGDAYRVTDDDGQAWLVKIGSTQTYHTRRGWGEPRSPQDASEEMRHEAGIANELQECGVRVVPTTIYVELPDGRGALVREYGDLATTDLSRQEFDRLTLDLLKVLRLGYAVRDELLIARRPSGSLFVADVGLWGVPGDAPYDSRLEDLRNLLAQLSGWQAWCPRSGSLGRAWVPSIIDVVRARSWVERTSKGGLSKWHRDHAELTERLRAEAGFAPLSAAPRWLRLVCDSRLAQEDQDAADEAAVVRGNGSRRTPPGTPLLDWEPPAATLAPRPLPPRYVDDDADADNARFERRRWHKAIIGVRCRGRYNKNGKLIGAEIDDSSDDGGGKNLRELCAALVRFCGHRPEYRGKTAQEIERSMLAGFRQLNGYGMIDTPMQFGAMIIMFSGPPGSEYDRHVRNIIAHNRSTQDARTAASFAPLNHEP